MKAFSSTMGVPVSGSPRKSFLRLGSFKGLIFRLVKKTGTDPRNKPVFPKSFKASRLDFFSFFIKSSSFRVNGIKLTYNEETACVKHPALYDICDLGARRGQENPDSFPRPSLSSGSAGAISIS
jgi:hypothetical protein